MAVTHRHRSIAILLLHHQLGHRLSHNVRATQNHAFLSACLNAITAQERQNSQRCGRDETRQSDGHTAHVNRVEAVYVLAIVNGFNDALLVDMLGQRQLYDEAVHVGIVVQDMHTLQEPLLGHIVLKADERRLETALLTGQHLVLHIGFRATVVPHEYSSQMGLFATRGHYLSHFLGNLRLDGSRRSFSVNQLHILFGCW